MIMLFLHTSFYIDNKIRNGRYLLKFSRSKKKSVSSRRIGDAALGPEAT